MTACGLDFGTSNSAIGVVRRGEICLTPVEGEATTIPTAVFVDADAKHKPSFGRQAILEYVEDSDGRLMRSLKSILGSSLMAETTALGRRQIAFADVITVFVRHLKTKAEAFLGAEIDQVVHGRPVHFVDSDDQADARAEASLAEIARRAGFKDVHFVYEPIAAAYHYETRINREEIVLVADIGGGTSDFSLVRIGPDRRHRAEREQDILANGGARIGGTDFDRVLSLDRVMPLLGLGSVLVEKNLPIPQGLYSTLATWSMINFLYQPRSLREIDDLYKLAGQPEKIARLVATVRHRRGHKIAFTVEDAKIALSGAEEAMLDLGFIEDRLRSTATRMRFDQSIGDLTARLRAKAARCIADAGLKPEAIQTIFMTGGSCQVPAVRHAIGLVAPDAHFAEGAEFLSVALGLTQEAQRRAA